MDENGRADFVQDLRNVVQDETFTTLRDNLNALHDKYRGEPFLFAHLFGITTAMGGLIGALEREPVRNESEPIEETPQPVADLGE